MEGVSPLAFGQGRTAFARWVERQDELPVAIRDLGLHEAVPTLVLVGGARGLSGPHLERLRPLFAEAVIPLVERLGAAVIDGGTAAGIMRLVGEVRAGAHGSFPLVGVAARGTVHLPGSTRPSDGTAQLEPGHSHFLLVPGVNWGDEAPWLAAAAEVLAAGMPSATLLVDGGEVTWHDVAYSLKMGRPVVVVDGSGRTADALAAAARGRAADERARILAGNRLVTVVALAAGPAAVARALEEHLGHVPPTA